MSPAACRLTLPVPGGLNHTHSVMGEAPWDGRGEKKDQRGKTGKGKARDARDGKRDGESIKGGNRPKAGWVASTARSPLENARSHAPVPVLTLLGRVTGLYHKNPPLGVDS